MLSVLAKIFESLKNPRLLLEIFGGTTAFILGLAKMMPILLRWWRGIRNRNSLRKRLGAELYSLEEILQATQHYIRPLCQSTDPNQEEESATARGEQADLFSTMDHWLANPARYKYILLLADSGMGKTAFVLNYYSRHHLLWHFKRRYDLALVPLGVRNADRYIEKIKDKAGTVLFLDAFDEDLLAIQDHRKRLAQLIEHCQDFRQVLITSRSQFFSQDEEIPRETGILKAGITGPCDYHDHLFQRLYLASLTDQQVIGYLHQQFPIWQWRRRQNALTLLRKIPRLSVRPMLLTHIKELVNSGKSFKYAFQLYEELTRAWIERERPFVRDRRALHEFSRRLAMDLYLKRAERGAERVHFSELQPLAQSFGINLADWQLRNRSLLNRDAAGFYKFAHRSIMEFLFVRAFLEINSENRPYTVWTDQMIQFLHEIMCYHRDQELMLPDLTGVDINRFLLPHRLVNLRAESQNMPVPEAQKMITNLNFFDIRLNDTGKGLLHLYYQGMRCNNGCILDFSTGLMWQQKGSSEPMRYHNAQEWIEELNWIGYSGHHDWRLPTLEEAMSLMEPKRNECKLFIDPQFDSKHKWIWTSDSSPEENRVWIVDFNHGLCSDENICKTLFVRAVRSDLDTKTDPVSSDFNA